MPTAAAIELQLLWHLDKLIKTIVHLYHKHKHKYNRTADRNWKGILTITPTARVLPQQRKKRSILRFMASVIFLSSRFSCVRKNKHPAATTSGQQCSKLYSIFGVHHLMNALQIHKKADFKFFPRPQKEMNLKSTSFVACFVVEY